MPTQVPTLQTLPRLNWNHGCGKKKLANFRTSFKCFEKKRTKPTFRGNGSTEVAYPKLLLTMVEVPCNACLHDACHVSHWCKATGAGCEKGKSWKAPPFPVQPGNDMGSECLACWDAHAVEQSQSITEETAERHVPLLQIHLWKGTGRSRNKAVEMECQTQGPGPELAWQGLQFGPALKKRRRACSLDF